MTPYQLVGKPGPSLGIFNVQLYHEEAFGGPILSRIPDLVQDGVQGVPFSELMTRIFLETRKLHSGERIEGARTIS
jgi:hypothetical protein